MGSATVTVRVGGYLARMMATGFGAFSRGSLIQAAPYDPGTLTLEEQLEISRAECLRMEGENRELARVREDYAKLVQEMVRLKQAFAEELSAWKFVPDAEGGHLLTTTGDKWRPEKQPSADAPHIGKRFDSVPR